MLEYVIIGLIVLFVILNIAKASTAKLIISGRKQLMQRLEKANDSRVITLIHRQKSGGMFSMLVNKFINIEDSLSILDAIRKTPAGKTIDFVVHTPGGLVLASAQIARALARHDGHVRVIVPHYAMSGGTLLALAADEIVMDINSVLGPVDPQIGGLPAASLIKLSEQKNWDEIDDQTHVLIDVSRKALSQMNSYVKEILVSKGRDENDAADLADTFVNGQWTHDHPLTYEFFKDNNFKVSTSVPEDVFRLMKMIPNIADAIPSVEYIVPLEKRQEPLSTKTYI